MIRAFLRLATPERGNNLGALFPKSTDCRRYYFDESNKYTQLFDSIYKITIRLPGGYVWMEDELIRRVILLHQEPKCSVQIHGFGK